MLFKQFLPPDYDNLDEMVLEALAFNIYERVPSIVDKFIIMSIFELHNSREDTARLLGVHYKTVWQRVHAIRKQLNPDYVLPKSCGKVFIP